MKRQKEGIGTQEKCAQAYKAFDANQNNLEVAIGLGLTAEQTIQYKRDYLRLKGYHRFEELYRLAPLQVESLLDLVEELSNYGITHEAYLDYIRNLNSREDLKKEIADLQNRRYNLIFKITDLKEEYYRIDSLCRAKKDNVDLEDNRIQIR